MECTDIQGMIEDAIRRHEREYHRNRVSGNRVRSDEPQTPEERNFELARVLWPGKKRGFRTEFMNFQTHHKDWRQLLDDDGLADCVKILMERKAYSPGFWPMFQTFCNQSRYEEAMQPAEVRK